ncbi:nitric oxide synthase oxygenase [Staphylococcus massiliensis]|uniref:nitric oxide synthase oxygenase n=1 Tax=Staphylococcus massiliensis TaxID=555791 RepID=UPI00370D71D7
MYKEAKAFIKEMYNERGFSKQDIKSRLKAIKKEIRKAGTYTHTKEELTYGAQMAWRHSNRCIGRFFWSTLEVADHRDVQTEDAFIKAIESHIVNATNNGRIKPYISVFSHTQPPKIHNNQLIRYAGYEDCGDPMERDVTQLAEQLGWQGQHTDFDVLPLIYQVPNGDLHYHEFDSSIIKEVPITHQRFEKVSQLNLKWYAVPIISNMDLKIGGITYPTAPFNGWYMVNDIAVRNFTDTYRYNLMEKVAHAMEFDTLKNNTFNKDRVLVELNDAVYYSFKQAGVSIVDHHTASKQFERFEDHEHQAGRKVTGKWSWLIPSLSPSLVSNYHHGYSNEMRDPNFHYKKPSKKSRCPFHS